VTKCVSPSPIVDVNYLERMTITFGLYLGCIVALLFVVLRF
jgi:hypothetical protein